MKGKLQMEVKMVLVSKENAGGSGTSLYAAYCPVDKTPTQQV